MLLNLSQTSSEPLHHQIYRQIRGMILSGSLKAEAVLPSIRALARDKKVSVITVQRAYDDLERAGLVFSRRGKPAIVAPIDLGTRRKMVRDHLGDQLRPLFAQATRDGLDTDDVLAEAMAVLDELKTKE